jgi:hypothetical protein
LWKALWRGRIQLTRRGKSARGHYVFATKPGEFGNSAGAFMRYGEVRGRNGVIIAEPTPHADGGPTHPSNLCGVCCGASPHRR